MEVKMKNLRAFVLCFFPIMLAGLAAEGCKKEPPVKPEIPERVKLTLIDVGVTEAYLHIAVGNPTGNETLIFQRNGATVLTLPAVADTNIADTALTQTTTYQYSARLSANNETTGASNTISTQTLAPTSHNFTWQTFLLGDGNGSALYDLALINDTLAYAVGEIYMGGDPLPYNLAKWDGQQWELKRVTVMFRGSPVTAPLEGIFAHSATDIWVVGSIPIHGNGITWLGFDIQTLVGGGATVSKGWGTPTDMYFVGRAGNIIRFTSGTWRRLESGTTTSILDAWGVVNPVTNATEVYCVAGNKLLRVRNGTRIDSVRWVGSRTLDGIWTHKGFPVFTSGDGVFENSSGECREVNIGASIYTNAIQGSSLNNIVAVGGFGLLAHFNGVTWNPFFQNTGGDYYNVVVEENLFIAVGEMNARGLIIIARRN